MATFHAMLSVSLQRVGMLVSSECPSPCGPRHPGHSPASAGAAETKTTSMAVARLSMLKSLDRRARRAGFEAVAQGLGDRDRLHRPVGTQLAADAGRLAQGHALAR